MRRDGLRRISPGCRSYWAKLDARGFSSTSWVSASRSQNLASVSHARLSSLSLQVFALRRHSLTSMRLLLLLSDIGQLAYPRRAYQIVSLPWRSGGKETRRAGSRRICQSCYQGDWWCSHGTEASQALAVLQYLEKHPSEFNDEDRARIKRIIADVPFANLMHEAHMEARQRKKDRTR